MAFRVSIRKLSRCGPSFTVVSASVRRTLHSSGSRPEASADNIIERQANGIMHTPARPAFHIMTFFDHGHPSMPSTLCIIEGGTGTP